MQECIPLPNMVAFGYTDDLKHILGACRVGCSFGPSALMSSWCNIKCQCDMLVYKVGSSSDNLSLQNAALISACESGDVMAVVSLLNSGADVQTEYEVYIVTVGECSAFL